MTSLHRSTPLAIEPTTYPPGHPAALAWGRLGGGTPARVELWRRPSRTSPSVHRLIFERAADAAVFAKRFGPALSANERTAYEQILPRLAVTVPRYLGACGDADGSTWMFLEDVGDRRLDTGDPGHRALAARWLGSLHASGAARSAGARLPDAGPTRYLAHLRSGRDLLRRHFGNPWLAAEDRPLLAGLVEMLEALEARWSGAERVCAGLPRTIVHGDLRAKNLRLGAADGPPRLYAFDWEMAGWGIPAADLGGAFGSGPTVPLDARVYRESVQSAWPDLDEAMLRRVSNVGRLFQALAAIDWACASLVVESARHMVRPVAALRLCRAQLGEAVEEGAEWLERS